LCLGEYCVVITLLPLSPDVLFRIPEGSVVLQENGESI